MFFTVPSLIFSAATSRIVQGHEGPDGRSRPCAHFSRLAGPRYGPPQHGHSSLRTIAGSDEKELRRNDDVGGGARRGVDMPCAARIRGVEGLTDSAGGSLDSGHQDLARHILASHHVLDTLRYTPATHSDMHHAHAPSLSVSVKPRTTECRQNAARLGARRRVACPRLEHEMLPDWADAD